MGDVAALLGTWRVDPVPVTGLLAASAGYLTLARRVDERTPARPWPRANTACFLAALGLTWLVVLGPVGAYDDTFFWAHMVQHLALMMAVPPLLLLGAPVLLVLRASPRRLRRRVLVPVLRSRLLAAASHPAVGWCVFAGVLLGTHLTRFYDVMLTHPGLHHLVEHPLYIAAGLAYFYPLTSANPGPRRLDAPAAARSMLLMTVPEVITGLAILTPGHVLFGSDAGPPRPFGPAPLADQRLGGVLMLAASLVMAAASAAAWARHRPAVAMALSRKATLAEG